MQTSELPIKTWRLHYPELSPVGDITGGNLSDYMQLPLEPQKAVLLSSSLIVVMHHESCKHTLKCKSGKLPFNQGHFKAQVLSLLVLEDLTCDGAFLHFLCGTFTSLYHTCDSELSKS